MKQEDIDKLALQIVEDEVSQWKDVVFHVTDKVQFHIRPLIQKCRKNYWGVFDTPKDKNTGRQKQWVPLTRVLADGAYKNSDTDSKDATARGNNRVGRLWSPLIRGYLRTFLNRKQYGELIDQDRLKMIIDGTIVWKTHTERVAGKLHVRQNTVDVLNCYLDPTSKNIQSAYRFTERSLLTPSEIKAMPWRNTNVVGKKNMAVEGGVENVTKWHETVDVYEMWGKAPKYLITLNEEDVEDIDIRIVASGIEGGNKQIHHIEENKEKDNDGNAIKPYEEGWYVKVPGRWYGVGIPEMVLYLQEWINLIVNLRIGKNTLAQTGILKWRSGGNEDISQQMVSALVTNGIIKVSDQDDLTSLQINPAGQESYTDEENVRNWAQQVSSIFDLDIGAPMPASTSATGAAIADNRSKSAFVMVKESWGQFQSRWIERHILKHFPVLMKQEAWTTVFGDFEEVKRVREGVVAYYAMQLLEDANEKGRVIDEAMFEQMVTTAEMQLRKDGDLFFDILEDVVTDGVTVDIVFTNEQMDVGVTVQNIIQLSNLIQDQSVKNDFVATAFDLLGLPVPMSLMQADKQPAIMARGTLDTLSQQGMATEALTMPSETAPTI